jgi:hypothetical protein
MSSSAPARNRSRLVAPKPDWGRPMQIQPLLRSVLTNLDQPMPMGEKLSKLVRNAWRRVVTRQSCCGHPGEPGC